MAHLEEADLYLEELVAWSARRDNIQDKELVRRTLRDNLGYYAGYYDDETRARVERLFSCEHPVFGRTVPSACTAFEAGTAAARDDNTHKDDGR